MSCHYKALGASAPVVTTAVTFAPCNPARSSLLAIQPGIPACDALEAASNYLDIAFENAQLAIDSPDNVAPAWAALHLIETSKAIVDAVIAGMVKTG